MYAIELRRQAQIGAVVHDEPHGTMETGRTSGGVPPFSLVLGEVGILTSGKLSSQFPRLLQHHPRVAGFIPILQQGHTSGNKFPRCGNQGFRVGKAAGIQNGIQTRKFHAPEENDMASRIEVAAVSRRKRISLPATFTTTKDKTSQPDLGNFSSDRANQQKDRKQQSATTAALRETLTSHHFPSSPGTAR